MTPGTAMKTGAYIRISWRLGIHKAKRSSITKDKLLVVLNREALSKEVVTSASLRVKRA